MTDTLLSACSGKIKEGDLVMVAFPVGEKTENPAHKYDGEQFVVKRKFKTNTKKGGDTYQYELYGAVSKKGIPYVFLTDELIRL
jgi:hypothetical protein